MGRGVRKGKESGWEWEFVREIHACVEIDCRGFSVFDLQS